MWCLRFAESSIGPAKKGFLRRVVADNSRVVPHPEVTQEIDQNRVTRPECVSGSLQPSGYPCSIAFDPTGGIVARYAALPDHIRKALESIEPSGDDELKYYPCRITLNNGTVLNTVYIEPEMPYLRFWGVYPEDDRGKRHVRIEDVVKVEDSPTRLLAQFANEIYRNGESGMGYTIFTITFADGEQQACVNGNAVDFIRYPDGKGPNDVVAVHPHEGRNTQLVKGPEYYWCLYSERGV